MIEGTIIRKLKRHVDERGFLCELIRSDEKNFKNMLKDGFAMSCYSVSHQGVIRAWHRHPRTEQVDTFIVLKGKIQVCVFNEQTKELDQHILDEKDTTALTIPGKHWHGYKVISNEPAILLYFPNKLYNYNNPDEERLSHDTNKIPYNWDKME
jgi:dTDP-4-dehydrorhamnose 3,5-epimerase